MLNCTIIQLGKAMETPLRWKDGREPYRDSPSGSCEIGRREACPWRLNYHQRCFSSLEIIEFLLTNTDALHGVVVGFQPFWAIAKALPKV